MAVKKCCVENCKSCSSRKEDKGVTYHKFPKDATSRNEWLHITRYKHTHKDFAAYVCSRHFCKGDFQKNKDSKYILKSDAVPSIFPWTIDNLKMDTSPIIDDSLTASTNDDEKNVSSSSKGSDSENLEAIKKFIEEQEKEIQENELRDKEVEKNKYQDSQNVEECKVDVITNIEDVVKEHTDIASSVMGMILSESEATIAKKVAEENAKDVPNTPIQDHQKITSPCDPNIMSPGDKGNATMSLSVGSKVEVKDFGEDWHPAEIAEVDYDDMEVLVRYDIELKKHDEWINVSSPRLRPFTGTATNASISKDLEEPQKETAPPVKENKPVPKKKLTKEKPKKVKTPLKAKAPLEKAPLPKETLLAPQEIEYNEDMIKLEEKPKVTFEVGERCLARWRDNRRFVATIHKDLGDGKFQVIFDDGFLWTCSVARMHKMKAETEVLHIDTSFPSVIAGTPSPLDTGAGPTNVQMSPSVPPAFHTHLFDPARDYLGSKSERREKKRKLNIKEIFNIGQKRAKMPKVEKEKTPKAPVVKKPRVVRKNAAPKATKAVPKVEIKTDVPDAVASIIGTKELEIKLEPLSGMDVQKQESSQNTHENNVELDKSTAQDDYCTTDEIKEEIDMAVDSVEPVSCVVDPNAKMLDDEDTEEPKSEGDSVLEEEVKLENFEKLDSEKLNEVLKRIQNAIHKLEDGIKEMGKINSPKVERDNTHKSEVEEHELKEIKEEAKPIDLKEVLAEAAASLHLNDSKTEDKESLKVEVADDDNSQVLKSKVPKSKKVLSKIKKSKKLRILQENEVKSQVEKVKCELAQMKQQFEEIRKQMLVQTKELVQSESDASPESRLQDGEWCCRWVNGQPVGKVSEIEGAVQIGVDNKPVLPRRSVEVDDMRLPPGWTKHMVRRSVGNSAGKWDVVLVSPDEHGNKRFHTKTDMRNFLEHCADDSLKQYEHALTDFGVHLKISRRVGWIVNTPDGITEAPETILPAGTTSHLSPLVKRKKLNVKKRSLVMKNKNRERTGQDKKRRPIKLKLQKRMHTWHANIMAAVNCDERPSSGCGQYKSEIVGSESSAEVQLEPVETFEPPLQPLEDGYVYVGSLKVQIIENLLRCPAESCFKNFRTKTLLQMHIKHYHRDLTTMMGATPKVLDLAYARTMPGEPDPPQPEKKIIKVKINKPPKREELRIPSSEPDTPVDDASMSPGDEMTAPIIPRIPRSQDSPKLRQALIHKPVKRPRVLLPVRRMEPEQAIPDSVNEDFFENPVEPVVEIPMVQDALDFESAISTHTVTKPIEKKKKSDKKKSFAQFSKNTSEDDEMLTTNSDDLDTRSSYPRSGSPDSKIMENKMAPMSSESNDDQKDSNFYDYTETGERVKIVHMKREEIINCHCGVREEDGLMVQCELCLCWQHALCHNIQRECEVPEKYTCNICLNPRRGRRSQRFLHDQDRMYEGVLPGAAPRADLRRAHELAGNLLRIHDALHALRVKYYVASKKDHPKLYLWAKDWEQTEITYTQEKLNTDYSDLNVMINGLPRDKDYKLKKDEEIGLEICTPPSEEQDTQDSQDADRPSQSAREGQLGSHSLLSGLLSSPGGASIDLPISTSELERLAKSVQESEGWQQTPVVPQPEAPIENSACRARLLKHIERCQALIDTRLDSIEAQVAELESNDPSFGEYYETAEFYPRTKQTVQMLMRDLDTMEELSVIT